MKEFRVAILTSFQTLGLEEWISGNDRYMSSVRCFTSVGKITDPQTAEMFCRFNNRELKNPQVFEFTHGKALKIRKEIMLKLVGHRSNLPL